MSTSPACLKAVHPDRLFLASCFALVVNGVMFAVISDIMNPLKEQFILTNQQVGYIGGAQFWGVTASILIAGSLCDALGMSILLRLALVSHVAGTLLMIAAGSFVHLFLGAALLGIGNGLVQGACNPLIAAVFPDRTTVKMNHLHSWFPGGIVLGGLICFVSAKINWGQHAPHLWQYKLALILLPTVVYGILFTGQTFPVTQRAQSGISFGGMVAATFTSPIFLLLSLGMAMTASLELGPNSWMPAVLGSAGISGILLLVWITGLMWLVRQFSGPIIRRLAPSGVLLACVSVAGVGLYGLSHATTTAPAFITATVFAIGISMIWPTMIGYTAERVPQGGAFAIAVIGGIGALSSGLLAAPQMGNIGDRFGHTRLDPAQTVQLLSRAADEFSALAATAGAPRSEDYRAASALARNVLDQHHATGALPPIMTANALRAAAQVAGSGSLRDEIQTSLLGPAENYGGRMSFRYVAVLGLVLALLFGPIHLADRARRNAAMAPAAAS